MLVLKTHTEKESWTVYPWVLYVRLSVSSLVRLIKEALAWPIQS